MPVKLNKICYRKIIATPDTPVKPYMRDMSLPLYSKYVDVGATYDLPLNATITYSDNTAKSVLVVWDKLVSTLVAGTSLYKASYTEDGITKTATFTLIVNENSSTANNDSQIGINVGVISDYYGTRAFANIMLTSRLFWVDYGASLWSSTPMSMDEYYNPNGDCKKVMWEASAFINGTYKVSFNGSCDSLLFENIAGSVSNKIYDPILNKTTLDMTVTNTGISTGGISLLGTKKTAISPTNTGISNFKCIRPGYTEDDMFTNEFLNVVKKFNVIRFLDWSLGNANNCINWEDRTLPDSPDQYKTLSNSIDSTGKGRAGVAYEYMIALCNITNCDMYLNLPIGATDAYFVSLCNLLKNGSTDGKGKVWAGLNPNLKIYFEYGNEIWNAGTSGFNNYGWVKAKSDIARADVNHPIMVDGNSDQYSCLYKYVGWRMCQISEIFRAEFGDAQMMTRIRPLIEGQLALPGWIKNALVFIDKYMPNPVNHYFYGGGGSAYYGSDVPKYKGGQYLTDHYFDYGMYPAKDFDSLSKFDNTLLKSYGLKKVAYEGGCSIDHTVTNGTYTEAMKRTIDSDERMVDMVVKCHNKFKENGGELLVYYYFACSPDWELTSDRFPTATYENKIPLDTPKMRAIDIIKNNNVISKYFKEASAMGVDKRVRVSDINNTLLMNGLWVLDAETKFGTTFDIPRDGTYRISACGNIFGVPNDPVAMAKTPTKVYVDGNLVGQIDFVVANDGAVEKRLSQPTTYIDVPISAGKRFIKIINDNKPSIYSLRVGEL